MRFASMISENTTSRVLAEGKIYCRDLESGFFTARLEISHYLKQLKFVYSPLVIRTLSLFMSIEHKIFLHRQISVLGIKIVENVTLTGNLTTCL